MQKFITGNKKFAMLAVLAVLIVTFVTSSSSPKLAEAPTDSNLAAVSAIIDGRVDTSSTVCFGTNGYTPVFADDKRLDNYKAEILIPGAQSIIFTLNIEDLTAVPAIALVSFDSTTNSFGFKITDRSTLDRITVGQNYTVNLFTYNSVARTTSTSSNTRSVMAKCPETSINVNSSVGVSSNINGSAERQTNLFTRASVGIRLFFTNIVDFFARLFGGNGSQTKIKSGGTVGGEQ